MRRTAALGSPLSCVLVAAACILTLPACGLLLDTSPPDPFPGSGDAGDDRDARTDDDAGRDAGPDDAGPTDPGVDAGPADAGFDAGPTDAGFDGGPTDAGFDAGPTDAGFDAGPRDAGFDAGPGDAGPCVDRDEDGDGVSTCDGDCADTNPLVYPAARERCGDGLDNDCNAATPDACSEPAAVYVSALVGDDSNLGTRDLPVATIGKGMELAVALGGAQKVVVGEGTYSEKVILSDGVSLSGGFHCDRALCDWTRDPTSWPSTIQNANAEGVLAESGVTEATLVEGFSILGFLPGAAEANRDSVGVTLHGGAPTLQNNRIRVGASEARPGAEPVPLRAIGVDVSFTDGGRSVQILGNDIRAGAAVNLSAGIHFSAIRGGERLRALAVIEGNVLQPGSALRSVGLVAWNTEDATHVEDNTFVSGVSPTGVVHGIEVGAGMNILRNRIHVPAPIGTSEPAGCASMSSWCAGIASQSATATIQNNVVFGPRGPRSTALLLAETERRAGAVIVGNNLLDGGGGAGAGPAMVYDKSAAIVVATGPCAVCGAATTPIGAIRNNILLGGRALARYGVYEDVGSAGSETVREARPVLLEHNLFHFAPPSRSGDILYLATRALGPMALGSITAVNGLTTPPARANLFSDPLIDATWHLLPDSPCVDQGSPDEAPRADFEGEARPRGAGFDIGPDEY
jgi:hypothetical protein